MTAAAAPARVIGRVVAAAAIVAVLVLGWSSPASAHHPEVAASTDCHDDGTWSVTFVARPDLDRPTLTWRIVSPVGYTPAGSQPASSSSTFSRTVTLPVSSTSVTETVTARWSNGAQGTRTATATLPQVCTLPTTTTSSTTTTTEAPPSTTSTSSTSTTSSTTSTTTPGSSTSTTVATTSTVPPTTSTSSLPPSSTSTSSSVPVGTSTTTSTPAVASSTTTTTVEQSATTTGPPPSSTSQATVSSLARRSPRPELPATGGGDTLVPWAVMLLCLGGIAVMLARSDRKAA